MKREIVFRNSVMDYNDMRIVSDIIVQIREIFTNRKYDYVYNCSDKIEISIEQIDSLSDKYEIEITAFYIIIKN